MRIAAGILLLVTSAWAASLPVLVSPIAGLTEKDLRDTYNEIHTGHPHEAIDIMVARGTPVRAVAPGTIARFFLSKPGGNTIYQFDEAGVLCYYYAHLDRYADGLKAGDRIKAGDVIGYAGSTGNASPDAPHLHFAVFELGPAKEWWKGTAVNPYTALLDALRAGRNH